MDRKTYLELLRGARKQSRREADAEDLLQTALLAAIEAGRTDMGREDNRRWMAGVLRNRARHEARTVVRRRRRDGDYQSLRDEGPAATAPADAVLTLPPALRITALLALTGHTRPEIAWLLNLSDTTLRKRISDIGRRLKGTGGAVAAAPAGDLPFGLMRQALLGPVRTDGAAFGSHDPDGNLFVVTSQTGRARQPEASDT